jgi:ankyrin repeat protein
MKGVCLALHQATKRSMNTSTINTHIRRWQRAILPLICLLFAVSYLPLVVSESKNELSAVDEDLFAALRKEDLSAASDALARGANINAISPKGQQTPLMQSVLHGRDSMVRWCLANGADTTIPEKDGYTPMHGAAFQGHAVIADMLLSHGVPLRDIHEDGFEPASEFTKRSISAFIRVYFSCCGFVSSFAMEPRAGTNGHSIESILRSFLLNFYRSPFLSYVHQFGRAGDRRVGIWRPCTGFWRKAYL